MSNRSNEELAILAQAGDAAALLSLWCQVKGFAAQRARKYEQQHPGAFCADDLLQEGFIGLLNALNGWSPDGGSFLGYYARCLQTSFAIASRRRTSRQRNDPAQGAISLDASVGDDEDNNLLSDFIPDPKAHEAFDELERQERSEAVRIALDALTAEERQIIRLRYWHGLTAEKVASALQMSSAAIKRIEASALRKLRAPTVSRKLRTFL